MRELNLLLTRILQISIEASILVVLILAAQVMLQKWIAPRWRCAMWGLLLIRLAMPILPESRWSALNLFQHKATSIAPHATAPQSPIVTYGILSDATIVQPTESKVVSVTPPPKPSSSPFDVITVIWAAGFVVLAVRLAIGMLRLPRRLAGTDYPATPILTLRLEECCRELRIARGPRLCVSSSISSPALCGIFRPTLVLPADTIESLSSQELRFVLLHELIHLKRWDVLAGSIFWIFNAIHWFNPVLWLAASRFRADREIACDAAVLAITHAQDRPAYGQTILKLLATLSDANPSQPLFASAALLQNRSSLKRRLAAIARPCSPGRRGSVIAMIVILVLGLLTLTRAQQAPATQPNAADTVERVYDVHDQFLEVQDFDAQKVDEWGFPAPPRAPSFSVPSSAPRFSAPSTAPRLFPIPTTQQSTRTQLLAKLVSDIEHTVAFESWKDNGGSLGSIRTLPTTGQLVITQTPENHDLIRAVLDIWKGDKAMQVVVESRFLGQLGELADKPPFSGKWVEENGIRRWSEFLDDTQVQKIVGSVAQNQNATTITAPRMTLFNHQRGYVIVSTTTAYVASVTPVKQDDGTIAFDPKIKNFPSGIANQIRSTVSDDHQSVKLELHDVLNRLISLEQVAAPESDPKSPAFYQIPHYSSVTLEATIDVPDGKTVAFLISPKLSPASNAAPTTNVLGNPPFMRSITIPDEPLVVLVKATIVPNR